MIIRVYRCTVVEGKEAEFREFVYGNRHPWLREQPGLIAFYAGRPFAESGERTRCMVQIWESESSIKAALGDDWRQPPKLPDETRAIVESASVEHYELADEFRASEPDSPRDRSFPPLTKSQRFGLPFDVSRVTIRPATPADASHLACFVDMASEGLALKLWEAMKAPEQTLFEVGRSRALREEGSFSYRNGHMAEIESVVAGALVGYKIAEVHDRDYRKGGDKNTPELPAFIEPLVELEAMVPGHWYVNILATYPEYRGHGIGKALLSHAEGLARTTAARGMAVIVSSENGNARRLYESVGYRGKASRPLVAVPGVSKGGEWLLMTKTS